ncbi:hypothetical protein Tco_0010329 [Tanacetum coccineum]
MEMTGTLLALPESVLATTNAPPVGDEITSNSKSDHSQNGIVDVESDQTRKMVFHCFNGYHIPQVHYSISTLI